MRKTLFSCLILSAFALLAADKPNFTGEWKMNASKSDFGPFPAPSSITRSITHQEPDLRMMTQQSGQRGEIRSEYKYAIDGKVHVNKARDGEVKSVLRWDGSTLQVDSERELAAGTFKTRDLWTLSGDGKTLTTKTHLSAPQGEADVTVVFDKQ